MKKLTLFLMLCGIYCSAQAHTQAFNAATIAEAIRIYTTKESLEEQFDKEALEAFFIELLNFSIIHEPDKFDYQALIHKMIQLKIGQESTNADIALFYAHDK